MKKKQDELGPLPMGPSYEALQRYRAGESIASIAKAFGYTPETIRRSVEWAVRCAASTDTPRGTLFPADVIDAVSEGRQPQEPAD